ncbi:polyprenyl synthetase family protein [Litorisediminicola beolgyonensis]|uniref:Polyprenyl synthetase family protein n=1 Tax=Litorisediminicola beolgyonensis TaxID=1173614 RepID=A0ABW3ZEK7_9RHOB
MNFETALASRAAEIGGFLSERLADLPEGPVTEAMRYSLDGGKRLRGFLVIESAAIFGIPSAHAMPAAGAIEALHAYSLVHDDLPAMDDDDTRRGKPTVHVKWDEATAILTGDALQSLAFELVAQGDLPAARKLDLSHSLALRAGARGMVRGQALDIAAESAGQALDQAAIEELQACKTGALIVWSCAAGPLMAGEDTQPLCRYADALGLAFQIADDILDIEGDAATVGKAVGKDADRGKATFVSLLGLDGAKRRARTLVDDACDALSPFGAAAEPLRGAARFVVSRQS